MKSNTVNKSKGLLRFTTAGSVDDGKSTLIGRLLYDSKSIFEDQMEHIVQSGRRLGRTDLDLSLLTDGLRAEREQGITIDVAYRYFATPARKFIVADTPGHIQYTRNMVTGASTADLAVILIDARKGMLEQTIRHSYIASLLDIKHIIFCINKMDMVEWSEDIFLSIKSDLEILSGKLGIDEAFYIPVSAKLGDNIVARSGNMEWYEGSTFLHILETVEISRNKSSEMPRFPVQTIIRPHTAGYHDHRGYAGRVAGGTFNAGDKVTILPSLIRSRIKTIYSGYTETQSCQSGDCVSILLDDDADISRGDMIVSPEDVPLCSQEIELDICWFNEKPLRTGGKYILRTHSNELYCIIREVSFRMNISNMEKDFLDTGVNMNDIARIKIKTSKPLYFDSYRKNNVTGSMILVDEGSFETAGAGMIA